MKNTITILTLILSMQIGYSQSFNGFAIYNKAGNNTTYLIDENENIAHTWNLNTECNYAVQLKENGNLIRGTKNNGNILGGAAEGGRVQEIAPDGSVVWDFIYSTDSTLSHHDLTLVGDNVLITAWEVKTAAEVSAAGYSTTSDKWPTHFIELEDNGSGGATIIWEWHMWDHMCQDVDTNKPNYVSNISDHPELIDINMIQSGGGQGPGGGDWFHVNGVDYNEDLDQIVFSSRHASEIFIIDHSTTTAEAASHSGGNSGMGGDILYRWGNPSNYGMSGSQVIPSAVHDARWITNDGRPNSGFLQIFNNCGVGCVGQGPGSVANSSIDGIETPWDDSTNTYLRTPGQAFGPSSYTTRYECAYSSSGQSASDRMSNGNVYVNASGGSGGAGVMYEVDSNGTIVWGPYPAQSHKGFRYECNYPGIIALEPFMTNTTTTSCFTTIPDSWDCDGQGNCFDPGTGNGQYSSINDCNLECQSTSLEDLNNVISIYPNPTNSIVAIEFESLSSDKIQIGIYNALGQQILNREIISSSREFKEKINLSDHSAGVYIVNIISNTGELYTKRISYIK